MVDVRADLFQVVPTVPVPAIVGPASLADVVTPEAHIQHVHVLAQRCPPLHVGKNFHRGDTAAFTPLAKSAASSTPSSPVDCLTRSSR